MIILDTNVLSALMQSTPDSQVVGWLDNQPGASIWITTITLFEARYGLALLPQGKRRTLLHGLFEVLIETDLEGRILLFDQTAAEKASQLAADRQKQGLNVDMRDTFIAAIALARRATLATRNIRHFNDIAIKVVNPWGL